MDQAASGTVLGARYVLGAVLGRGGMAEVFRARDTTLDREVAVKVFHQHAALPDGDLRRAGEVRLLARLSHPGLVTVFDAGRDTSDPTDPFAYLVMELVEGTTLAQAIASGPLPVDEVADIGVQLAAALDYVHGRGVVHRDIKPANVLLRGAAPARTAKLTDFGVARLVDSTRLTVQGTTLGTANYLSPEQTTGAVVGPASDIYALGLVLLEALTGQVAYPGAGVEAAIVRLHRPPAIPSWLGRHWQDLITEMTAFDADGRPDAAEVERRLRAIRRGSTESTELFAAAGTRQRRRPPVWIAAGLAVATALAALVLGVLHGTDSSSGSPVPTYPAVHGALGTHLRALQDIAPTALRPDVLALTTDAAEHRIGAAQAELVTLSRDLDSLDSAGKISGANLAAVRSAISAVSTDLRALAAAAASSSAAASASAAAASREAASEAAAARAAAARVAASRAAASRAAASRAAASRSAAKVAAARSRSATHSAPAPPPPPAKHHGPGHGPGPKPGHGPKKP